MPSSTAQAKRLSGLAYRRDGSGLQVEAAVGLHSDRFGGSPGTALATPSWRIARVEDALFKINRRIANLGTINPDAAEEYDALKVRYDPGRPAGRPRSRPPLAREDQPRHRRADEGGLHPHTCRQLDRNFRRSSPSSSPGGSAVVAGGSDDVENTGVEVNAQPKGKRISKMMLLSGGEKSLTALALLFAVYRIRSTPFYILDEVEAALDDTNLRRLAAYIDSLRDETQLIMITHQRRTMEMADVLFGVSMQGDGVTKVISQKLDQALKHAE